MKVPEKDGIYVGLDYDTYAQIDAVNQSYLNQFAKSPKHAQYWRAMGGSEETAARAFGSAVHLALLEPSNFDREVLCIPKLDKRTTAGKKAWAEFKGKADGRIILQPDDHDRVKHVARSIVEHPTARLLFASKGGNEVSIVWTDPETGVRCKARVDRITQLNGTPVVMDLKTTRDVTPRKFQTSLVDYGYDIQGGFTLAGLDVLRPIANGSAPQRVFVFLAVESDGPFDVGVFHLNEEAVLHAQQRIRRMLKQYAQCKASGVWPGKVGDGVELLDLPEWSYKREPLAA